MCLHMYIDSGQIWIKIKSNPSKISRSINFKSVLNWSSVEASFCISKLTQNCKTIDHWWSSLIIIGGSFLHLKVKRQIVKQLAGGWGRPRKKRLLAVKYLSPWHLPSRLNFVRCNFKPQSISISVAFWKLAFGLGLNFHKKKAVRKIGAFINLKL